VDSGHPDASDASAVSDSNDSGLTPTTSDAASNRCSLSILECYDRSGRLGCFHTGTPCPLLPTPRCCLASGSLP
jgi:hypothetical protein